MSRQLILSVLALECAAKLSAMPVTLTWLAYGDKAPEDRLWIEDANVEIATRLIEGPYPNWRLVWPRENDKELTVERKPFLATVKRITSLANDQTHRIALTMDGPKGVTVNAKTPDMTTEESVEATYSGEPLRIGANGAYLTPILAALDSENVRLTFKHTERAMTIDGNGADPYLSFLLMPLRLVD